MGIVNTVKHNLKKFVPAALKKRFGMSHGKRHKKHGR